MTALCLLEGLEAKFDGQTVLHGIDLEVPEGAFLTLLGPSGCGKSTTLRLIGGFGQPSAGRILIRGKDITRDAAEQRPTNMVFQDYALFPHLSVAQNVGYGLRRMGQRGADLAARVRDLLALVQLEEFADRAPQTLSGGQRQRVALARALARDPALLLLDEPLAALDAQLRDYMQSELKSLQRQTGKSFIFVTHDQDEALAMSDLVAVMNAGRIEQVGSPDEIYRRPQSRFVASFIGRSNLIDGTLHARDGNSAQIDTAQGRFAATLAPGSDLTPGAKAALVIRAENVRPSSGASGADGVNTLTARLTSSRFRGSHWTAGFALSDGTRLQADTAEDWSARSGPEGHATLTWNAADASIVRA